MRELTSHKVKCDEIAVLVQDEPGHGGAHHAYAMIWNQKQGGGVTGKECEVRFQNGPIAEVGTNGVTHEALLAILIDRLECFQKGGYSCRENAIALTHLQDAMHWLQHRTRERLARGVEGTHQK